MFELKMDDLKCNFYNPYDNCDFSITEQLTHFMKTLNEVIMRSNTDHDFIQYLTNEGLASEVAVKLKEWLDNGQLDEIISNEVLNNLYENVNALFELNGTLETAVHKNEWYTPTLVKECTLGTDGIPLDYCEENYEEFFDWKYNQFCDENPTYVTKRVIGRDSTDTFNIYAYDFKPQNYEKTILINGCLHGDETSAFFGLGRLFDEIVNRSYKTEILNYFRNKIRFVVVPVANPYGFCHQIRQNGNGVDLNRNFGYLWDEYNTESSLVGNVYYKGVAPFSESETRALRDLADELSSEKLSSFVDFHNLVSIKAEKILYYPRYMSNVVNELSEMIQKFDPQTYDNRMIMASSTVPSATNYICHKFELTGANPEFNSSVYGVHLSYFNMRKTMEWYGNIINTLARVKHKEYVYKPQPFTQVYSYDASKTGGNGYKFLYSSSNNFNTFEKSKHQIELNGQYLVNVYGWAKLKCVKSTTVQIQPMLYQQYAPENNYTTHNENRFNTFKFEMNAGEERIIPITASTFGMFCNYNSDESSVQRTSFIEFRIRGNTANTDAVYLESYNVNLSAIPTNSMLPLERFDDNDESILYPKKYDRRLNNEKCSC